MDVCALTDDGQQARVLVDLYNHIVVALDLLDVRTAFTCSDSNQS
jgi:hypothetical protein